MIVNIRARTDELQYKTIIEDYLNNVSPRYKGEYFEENRSFIKDFMEGKDLSKYLKLGVVAFYASMAILGILAGDVAYASNGIINTTPLDRFFKEVYWTMFKVLMYIATPVWAWVGIILSTSGANQEKRTMAKKVGTGLVFGTGITASAPYVTKQLFALWTKVFA